MLLKIEIFVYLLFEKDRTKTCQVNIRFGTRTKQKFNGTVCHNCHNNKKNFLNLIVRQRPPNIVKLPQNLFATDVLKRTRFYGRPSGIMTPWRYASSEICCVRGL